MREDFLKVQSEVSPIVPMACVFGDPGPPDRIRWMRILSISQLQEPDCQIPAE